MRRRSGGSTTLARPHTPIQDALSLIRTFNSETNPARPIRPSPLAASQIQGMPIDTFDRIRSFPLFQTAPDEFFAAIGQHLRPQVNSPNDYILTEGDDAKAMYWLVRGAVAVTSRDGESTYAELKPGAFFGEIGILMDRPRTATILARTKCLLVVLKKEDLRKELPNFPDVEKAIRDEAQERLAILERKKKETSSASLAPVPPLRRGSKRLRSDTLLDTDMEDAGAEITVASLSNKKRKSPSPGLAVDSSSALASGLVNVRQLLRELPLFSRLPSDALHFLGLNAQPCNFPPFTDIIEQESSDHEVYFIVAGEVEVIDKKSELQKGNSPPQAAPVPPQVKARLRPGQYFGEIVGLSLAPRRTATVRSVTQVECLMISGDVHAKVWDSCPPNIRREIENTAKARLQTTSDGDILMSDAKYRTPPIDELVIAEPAPNTPTKQSVPRVTFTQSVLEGPRKPARIEDQQVAEPSDPDPFLSVDMDNMRSRSRRNSLAPKIADEPPSPRRTPSPSVSSTRAPSPASSGQAASPTDRPATPKRQRTIPRSNKPPEKGPLPDNILEMIFQYLDIREVMQLRIISLHWSELLSKSPNILHILDLAPHNRRVTDEALINQICPFAGSRPRVIDISNCFHITDEGFTALATFCGANAKVWRMKSVWDITASAILEMSNRAKGLQEIDLSNCRKVGDQLLARIVGWTVANPPPQPQQNGYPPNARQLAIQQQQQQYPPGTVLGCPQLKKLTLSYCKHVTDRSMHYIATHAAPRLEQIDLTRCTTITDQGFQYWGNTQFSRLRKLCLADCTYLTDNAIVYLTNAAKGLKELDLVGHSHLIQMVPPSIWELISLPLIVLLLCPLRHVY